MDRATAEVVSSKRIQTLVAIAGAACVITSFLYVLTAVSPLFYFYGYVGGYYSLLDYRLYYTHNGHHISMPHTDYVRHVSIAFVLLSLTLFATSVLSLVFSRRRQAIACGLAYGASAGLIVLRGLLNGYILRAIFFDLGRFNHLIGRPNNEVMYRTLAGVITFEGVRLEQTPIYSLALTSIIPPTLIAIAVTASALAAGLALHTIYRATSTYRPSQKTSTHRKFLAYTTLFITSLTLLASVFTYYPSSIAIAPQRPSATLETPPYVYICTISRTSRGALTYTDFEVYPVPGWATSGGKWSSVSRVTGAKGNVTLGDDDDQGVGRASHYYYNTDLSARTSLWVVAKTRYDKGGKVYYGISMMNSGRNRVFAVEVYRFSDKSGYLEIWSYGVTTTGWTRHGSTEISGYDQDNWYVIVVHYSVSGTTINIIAYLYDVNGNYVTSVSATVSHSNVFAPAYIGVIVDGGSAYFDDFIISTADPRSILFTGLQMGMRIEVWDNLGNLVASGTAAGTSLSLGIVHDVVVGTGVDGRIVVRLPDGSLCVDHRVPVTDVILGGDIYRVEYIAKLPVDIVLGANKTSANVSIPLPSAGPGATVKFLRTNTSQTLYARLMLVDISAPTTLNLDLWIEGVTRSTNITIRNGMPVTTSTSIVQLNLGLNNNMTLFGYFTAAGQSATLYLRLELCTAPSGMGACVYYPIRLDLSSTSSSSSSIQPGLIPEEPTGPGLDDRASPSEEQPVHRDESSSGAEEAQSDEVSEPPNR